jgi:hypothetical protein
MRMRSTEDVADDLEPRKRWRVSFVDLVALIAVTFGALVLAISWVHTDEGRASIARQIEQHVGEGIRGNLTIGSLDHVGLDGLAGTDVVFRDESGRPVIEARNVALQVDWGELLSGHVVSPLGSVHGGRIWLETIPTGEVLIDRAFKSPNPGPPGQPIGPDVVRLERLAASDVELIVNVAGSPHMRASHLSTICEVRSPEHGAARLRADRVDAALRIAAPHPLAMTVVGGVVEIDGASRRRAHIDLPGESHGEPFDMVVAVRAGRGDQMHVHVDLSPGNAGSVLVNGPVIAEALLGGAVADALDVSVHMP